MRELHELLRHYAGSEQRYKDFVQSMRNSTLTAFYTPPAIVRALAEALRDAGVVPRRLLDPSAGAGIFPSSFRETADGEVEILSFEKDLLTGQVLSALAREREQVVIDGFQTIESAYDSYFDVVTSNIPFGDTRIFDASFRKSDDPVRRQALKAVHNYFFIKGLDTLREGGILAFVTSAGVMDAPGNEPVRRYLMEHARLLSAVRLPNNLFTEYAGTEVASDLVVLQKQSEKRKLTPDEQRFVSSSEIGNGIYLNDYHRDFKHAIHTTFSHEKGLYGQSALVLHYDGGPERIAERLRGILANAFAARLDTERYTQYLRPLHIPQAQTVPPTARRQNRVAAPQSVAPPEPASVAPTPEISAPAASLFGSAAAVPIARRPLGSRRRAGRNTDTTGMSDLFTQGNLFAQPAEAAEATDAPAAVAAPASENKDPRPFTGTMLPHYKERSLVLFEGQVGRLGGLTRQGCTFHPEELGTLSRYRAERYIPLRDTYQLLYRLERCRARIGNHHIVHVGIGADCERNSHAVSTVEAVGSNPVPIAHHGQLLGYTEVGATDGHDGIHGETTHRNHSTYRRIIGLAVDCQFGFTDNKRCYRLDKRPGVRFGIFRFDERVADMDGRLARSNSPFRARRKN
mgnify:CR=1 FL=1